MKRALVKPARFVNSEFLYLARIEAACARGALNVALRRIEASRPASWEFCAFSQNGEDGVIDHLLGCVQTPNRYFIEVGAGDGLENNTAHLAFAKKYPGLMIDGNRAKSHRAGQLLQPLNWAVKYRTLFVTPENAARILDEAQTSEPDFFSLDIDGNDFYVMQALFKLGFRPRIVCVEFNSAFGPDQSVTIPYTERLDYLVAHPSQVYYGASIMAWRNLFARHSYRFVTVETHGINAFFVDPTAVQLPDELDSLLFAENTTQFMRRGGGWEHQLALIQDLPLSEVG